MTIKTGVPHTKLLLRAGMCFGPLPISEHVWLSLSLLID